MGLTMGKDTELEVVTQELAAGRLWPTVAAVLPLSDGRDAVARMQREEHFGTLVLRVSDD